MPQSAEQKILDDRCAHCRVNKRSRPRGLCFKCSGNKSIRLQYPTSDNKSGKRGRHSDDGRLRCWSCPAVSGDRRNINKGKPHSWRSRRIKLDGYAQTETYCPDCFRVWGWPDKFFASVGIHRSQVVSPVTKRRLGPALAKGA